MNNEQLKRGRGGVRGAMVLCCLLLLSFGKLSAQSGEWDLHLGPTFIMRGVMILAVRPDSVVIDRGPGGYGIALDSITMLRRLRGSFVGEGIAGGLLGGMLIGGLIPAENGGYLGGHGFAFGSAQLAKSVGYGLVGSIVGGVVGAFVSRDELYDIRSMSRQERYDLLMRLQYEQ